MDNFENNNLPQENGNTRREDLQKPEQFPKNGLPPVTEAETAQAEQTAQTQPQQSFQTEQYQHIPQTENTGQPTQQNMQNMTFPYSPQGQYQPQAQFAPQEQQVPPKKRRFSTGCLCIVIAAVILMFMLIVVVSAAISVRDGSKKNDEETDFSAAIIKKVPPENDEKHVTVKIPTVHKPVLEEEMYKDKETGLLTTVGVAKTILPSQVKINAFGEVPYLPASSGSGIILTTDGYILTNAHVIDDASRLAVELYDGSEEKASVIGMDKKSDLAVIKIDRNDLSPAEIGTSADLVIGEEVALAGAGGGFANTVTYGYVTGLDREIDTDYINSSTIRCIQTDVALNPGNSGGALVNMYGQVVGVAVALMNHEKYENIGFSIAIDDAVPIAEELMAKGYVSTRARVGVTFVSVGDDFAKIYKVESGLCIMEVDPTCDVARAGLAPYDIITHIDGVRVYGTAEILEALSGKVPGDEVTLTVFRKEITGDPITFDVSVELAPDTSSMSGYSVSKDNDGNKSYDVIK